MTSFVLSSSTLGGTDTLGYPVIIDKLGNSPLTTIIKSYPYFQYTDDDDIMAFVASYNEIAQSYLDWFNSTPLGVYTSPNISGTLLDWVGTGLYGYARPTQSTPSILGSSAGGYGYSVMGQSVYGMITNTVLSTGSATYVNDDIYKRALTWHLYRGDGRQMSISWLKRRIARFLYGANGTDIPVDYLQNIDISFPITSPDIGSYGTASVYGMMPSYGMLGASSRTNKILTIKLPNTTLSNTLQSLLLAGELAMPFQVKTKVILL